MDLLHNAWENHLNQPTMSSETQSGPSRPPPSQVQQYEAMIAKLSRELKELKASNLGTKKPGPSSVQKDKGKKPSRSNPISNRRLSGAGSMSHSIPKQSQWATSAPP
ncbi:hypothetical protein O181_031855 [Austropuccinia psidii MF-1]|uniref:Uncharacterized protein n=1 Tax=Austropuccinia psidii MF-1 TaxID=1389203 RepID=A0A9Q3CZZ2_9BASI|nr:hypothetical protein [Austropuccinia psidii MF-1]